MALKQGERSWYNETKRPVAARLRKQRNLMAAIDKIGRYMKPVSAYDDIKSEITHAQLHEEITQAQAKDLRSYIKEYLAWSTK